MLRRILFIARKDLQYSLREKETLLWVFVMPIVFFFFIGTVMAGFARDPSRKDAIALWAENDDFLVAQLAQRLEERGYAVVRPQSEASFAAASRRLRLPPAFADSVQAGRPVQLEFGSSQEGLSLDYDDIRVKRAVYTLLADIIVAGEQGEGLSESSLAALDARPRALQVQVESAGERRTPPTGFSQAVPGIMVMFTLLVMATSGAILLVIERRNGLLRRLAYAPFSRLEIVLGKWGGKLVLGMVQIAFAMLAGTLLFKMDWGADLGMVFLVMLAYGALTASIGILLGSLARSEGQAAGIGVIAANVLGALGGCWWPIEIAPGWAQKLQLFLPTGWAMDALHKLISFQTPPGDVLWHLSAMLAGTAILLAISARVFRYE